MQKTHTHLEFKHLGLFLHDLTADDLREGLGIKHELHIKKIVTCRDRIRPLTRQERDQLDALKQEDQAQANRKKVSIYLFIHLFFKKKFNSY